MGKLKTYAMDTQEKFQNGEITAGTFRQYMTEIGMPGKEIETIIYELKENHENVVSES